VVVRASAQRLSLAWPRVAHRWRRALDVPGWVYVLALAALALALGWYELRTSALQALVFSRLAAALSYTVEPGPSPRIAFPADGPFDERRGYARLPELQRRLAAAGWRVVEQARQSPGVARLVRWGITPPYREPAAAGLVVLDRRGATLYDARPRGTLFRDFEDVPPLVVRTLVFLENRALEHPPDDRTNPAVDWPRLAKAGALWAGGALGLPVRVQGGSTLATQMEKYEHSAHGRTASPWDKARQIAGASLRAYRDGPDTTAARRQLIVDYLNTMPLAAAPGHGEVHGLGPGLRVWFGLGLAEVSRALADHARPEGRARAFKPVLALLYAVRAPSRYLVERRDLLERRIEAQADALAAAGVIDTDLARRLRRVPLVFRAAPAPARDVDFVERKAAVAIREELRRLLGVPGPYELDRLHLEVESTVDGSLQAAATRLFHDLGRRDFVRARGLGVEHLLATGDPGHVVYSLLLYERTPEGNLLRVRADNLDAPFDVNAGMKLELGSTAKLRTAAHYLEVMAELHAGLRGLDAGELDRRAASARDPLTRWAAETLRREPALDIDAFLARAMERSYPASPHEVFYTGGGEHTFRNFDDGDDGRVFTVRQALARSVNLVFIRLMRDLVRYHEARLPYDASAVLDQPDHPLRERMLREMADEDSRQHLARAWRSFRGLDAGAVIRRLLGEAASSRRSLAALFFAWYPGAEAGALAAWLGERGVAVTLEEAADLARAYGNPRLTIADYGYLLDRHPLAVWCAGELVREPDLTWEALLARSEPARRVASEWLFQTRHRAAQQLRLRTRIERDAFDRMAASWRRLGFPFERLVPSLATAIGASADRPAALAELMGIVVNDGVRRPPRAIRHLAFARGTPYHTVLEPPSTAGERVLAAPVARALRAALAETVESGTARRVRGAFVAPGGAPALVGGKTGSGDNRFETFGPGRRLVSSRPVSRTSAFVFYIGDRYFGVVTASVAGPRAGDYAFTSALPLAVLQLLAPEINARLAAAQPLS
jgi:membrane peptidoglycan carboxypeptidase